MLLILLAGESHKDPAANNFILQCMKKYPNNILGYFLEAPNDMSPAGILESYLQQDLINSELAKFSDKERSFIDYDRDYFDRRFQIRALNQTLSHVIGKKIPYQGIELEDVLSSYIINEQHQASKSKYFELKALRNKHHFQFLSKQLLPYLDQNGILIISHGADHIEHTKSAIQEIFIMNNFTDYNILPCFIYSNYSSPKLIERFQANDSIILSEVKETNPGSCNFDHQKLLDEVSSFINPTKQINLKSPVSLETQLSTSPKVSSSTFLNEQHDHHYLNLLNWLKKNSCPSKISTAIHDKDLELAFRLAAAIGHFEIMKQIMSVVKTSKEFSNFSINSISSNGNTALDWAQEKIKDANLRANITLFLKQHGAISCKDNLISKKI